jgi:CDP-diacylglycerol--glycerol-3-phosphate 3-phosphatidyltransferase
VEKHSVIDLTEARQSAARWFTAPLVTILGRSRLKPNTLTWLGLITNIIAAVAIATNHLIAAGLLVLLSGIFDLLDGALARFTNQTTRFGALLDSIFDRISEALLFLGLLALYTLNFTPTGFMLAPGTEYIVAITLVFLAMVGAFLTSYVRARAEGLGIECRVGLFTRFERVIILALGLVFNQILIALLILAVLAFATVGQRLAYVRQQTRS